MSKPITIPSLGEIEERLRACRQELAALRKLYRYALAAQKACEAQEVRQAAERVTHAQGARLTADPPAGLPRTAV